MGLVLGCFLVALVLPNGASESKDAGGRTELQASEHATQRWSLLALGSDVEASARGSEVHNQESAVEQPAEVPAAKLPSWAWGLDVSNMESLYDRWAAFAATQGGDHSAVDSLVGLLRQLGRPAIEDMASVAITRADWRVTSAVIEAGFVGIEELERQEMVRRIVHGKGCANAPECAFMNSLNEIAPGRLAVLWTRVRSDRDACGSDVRLDSMLAVSRAQDGQAWCQQTRGG